VAGNPWFLLFSSFVFIRVDSWLVDQNKNAYEGLFELRQRMRFFRPVSIDQIYHSVRKELPFETLAKTVGLH
jgi:hypothetical protein